MKFQSKSFLLVPLIIILACLFTSCSKVYPPPPLAESQSAPIDKKTFETLTLRMADIKEKDPSISPQDALEQIKTICYEEGFPFVSSKDFLDKYTASAMVYRMDADLILGMVERKCELEDKQKP
jgi:hypothetical protein